MENIRRASPPTYPRPTWRAEPRAVRMAQIPKIRPRFRAIRWSYGNGEGAGAPLPMRHLKRAARYFRRARRRSLRASGLPRSVRRGRIYRLRVEGPANTRAHRPPAWFRFIVLLARSRYLRSASSLQTQNYQKCVYRRWWGRNHSPTLGQAPAFVLTSLICVDIVISIRPLRTTDAPEGAL